ncbi:hypothetical protein NHQ30_008885 [Ciborinia camelliae]|nr:hypothetical protein NHQ30_008885 [Ciborinia camelliae]
MSSTTDENSANQNQPITLQVGSETFTSTFDTLTSKSEFFQKLLSPPWARPEPNGSYFLDRDPVLFRHILQYLRRNQFPIFYDDVKGHDHAMYLALLQDADYYLLKSLSGWLKERKYLQVVRTKYSIREGVHGGGTGSFRADAKVLMIPKWSTVKEYRCPMGSHNGKPDMCPDSCKALREELGVQWKDRHVLGGVMLIFETTFLDDLCVDRS